MARWTALAGIMLSAVGMFVNWFGYGSTYSVAYLFREGNANAYMLIGLLLVIGFIYLFAVRDGENTGGWIGGLALVLFFVMVMFLLVMTATARAIEVNDLSWTRQEGGGGGLFFLFVGHTLLLTGALWGMIGAMANRSTEHDFYREEQIKTLRREVEALKAAASEQRQERGVP